MSSGGGEFRLTIGASVANPDIRALATAAGWYGQKLIVDITAPLINTLDLGSTPFASGIQLNISAGTRIGGVKNGGLAFKTRVPVSVYNLGIISGGGGAGGTGEDLYVTYAGSSEQVHGAGGSGGHGQGFASASSLTVDAAQAGGAGTYAQYSGSTIGGHTRPFAQGGAGGAGGAWGAAGEAGKAGSFGGTYDTSWGNAAAPGLAAGAAVDGNSNVIWLATGTRVGALIN